MSRLLSWRFALPLFCACFSFHATNAVAASSTRILSKSGSPVLISAGTMFGDSEKQTVELVGDVQMTFDGQSLRADRAIMDKKNGKILAEGNVIIASPSAYVEGSKADISYEDSTGLIYDGFVKSDKVLFQGKLLRKVGPDKYIAEESSYTACTTCPAAWSFSGTRIDAEIGSYAYIKSAWFSIGGFRFFWLPYLVVPLKSERQSGMLFPLFQIDGINSSMGIPFFWAISRSQDMTIIPKYYQQRGLKGLVNYRYILNEESSGELNVGALVKDSYFANDTGLPTLPGDERAGRWFLSHDHFYNLPGGFVNRAKINLVSDLRYTRDFPEDIKGQGEPSLENRVSLTKNSELMHSSVEAAYYVNQLKKNPLEGNGDSVHRFPEIKQSGVDRTLFGERLFFRWDFNYVNFAREDFAFDDVIGTGTGKTVDPARGRDANNIIQPGSGTFEPATDVIRTGQRLDLRPEISLPFRVGRTLDVLPSVTFRHTQYSFNVAAPAGSSFEPNPMRDYVRTKLALRTQFSRIYEMGDESETIDEVRAPAAEADGTTPGIFQALQTPTPVKHPERLKHEIEPEIAIAGIPWLQQTNSPFFGNSSQAPIFIDGQPVSNSDFFSDKGLQFDYEDRITLRNVISALVTNKFTRKTWVGDQAVYRQVVSIKNGTSYEYDKPNRLINGVATGDAKANLSDVFTIIDARLENFTTNTSIRYFPYHGLFNTTSIARVNDLKGNFFQLSFSQNYLITENVQEAYPSREENVGFAFGVVQKYVTLGVGLNYTPVSYSPLQLDFRLKSWSALINLRPPGDCWGFRLNFTHDLGEPRPRVGVDFDYVFGGAS